MTTSTRRPVTAIQRALSQLFRTRLTPRLPAAALLGLAAVAAAQAAEPAAWVKNRLVVQARAGVTDAELERVLKAHGGQARRIGRSDLHIVTLPGNASERAVQALLAHHPLLKFAELDGLVAPSLAVNDPFAGSQWHLGQINAAAAWETAQGQGVTIAVVDTGVDSTHPDLSSRIVPGWNFFNNTADTSDEYNHGTGVAGTAAAASNNGVGVAGVAGQARIMPLRISDASGLASWSAMAQALVHAADNGVRVANISYQVGGVSTVQSAAAYMRSRNGLVFVSAGNTSAAVTTPADPSLIVVGATTTADTRASWSTWGPYVTLSAPGTGIYTTTRGNGYAGLSGTSFASPVAAGVAAAVMSARPELSNAQVESILTATAADLGPAGRDPEFGFGRVDAAAAVRMALATVAADTAAPSAAVVSPRAGTTVAGSVLIDATASDNVGVSRVELLVNGSRVASDSASPFGFAWDSTKVRNGAATLAVVAYDAAGNASPQAAVSVTVANAVAVDTTPPTLSILNPANGSTVAGNVAVSGRASDNAGPAGLALTLAINGRQVARATGGALDYNWNTRKAAPGRYTLTLTATDAAGNRSQQSVSVIR